MKKLEIIESYNKQEFIEKVQNKLNTYNVYDIQYNYAMIGNIASSERLPIYIAYITLEI